MINSNISPSSISGGGELESNPYNRNPDTINKADKTELDGIWSAYSTQLLSRGKIEGNNLYYTFDLSAYLPNDNNAYDVLFNFLGEPKGKTNVKILSDIIGETTISANNANYMGGNVILPVGTKRFIKIYSQFAALDECWLWARGYRKLGNSE